MRYLLAIIFPPLAVLMCGRPILSVLNFGLWLLLWIPGTIHALMVIRQWQDDRRAQRIERAVYAGAAANMGEQRR